jgi:hypothetical protein
MPFFKIRILKWVLWKYFQFCKVYEGFLKIEKKTKLSIWKFINYLKEFKQSFLPFWIFFVLTTMNFFHKLNFHLDGEWSFKYVIGIEIKLLK